MNVKKVLSIFVFCSQSFVWAQSPVFSKTAQQYNRLTGATQVMKDSVWDDADDWKPAERNIPLGFTFRAFNKDINTFIWDDAAIEFRQADTVIKIGLEADFCDYGFGTKNAKSKLYRKTEGTAPNRIVKIEWQKAGFWDEWADAGLCKDSADLQIWIYESPAKIELRFGPRSVAAFNKIFPDKLGVTCAKYDGTGGTSGLILDGDPINPVTYSFGDTGTRGLTSWPVPNQVYIFDFNLASTKALNGNNGTARVSGNMLFTTGLLGESVELLAVDGKKVAEFVVDSELMSLDSYAQPGIYILKFGSKNLPPVKVLLSN